MTGAVLRLFDPESLPPRPGEGDTFDIGATSGGPGAGQHAPGGWSPSAGTGSLPPGSGSAAVAPALTDEQLAAVARRQGSLLLSANAGSGKTSVLVERYVAAVIEDGLTPAQILAITFTERAAGELRQRIRDRLLALGRRDAARETDSGFVLTVHGFCARVLRAHPWDAGLDPSFSILDERTANAAGVDAFRRALARFLDRETEGPELDLVAAWSPERVASVIATVHDQLRSRGLRAPHLPDPAPAPDLREPARALQRARDELAAELAECRTRPTRVIEALERLDRCAALLRDFPGEAGAPPDRLAAVEIGNGNVASLQTPAADAYRRAWSAYRQAGADRLGVESCALLDRLLRDYAAIYASAKRDQAAVDFDDLELAARDLLREPSLRSAWAERFELLMVDECQDINARQLEILEALERNNLFCVGDELQSIYRFRHADVELFRRRRKQLAGHGATACLTRNFRARPELLEAINAAFAPIFEDSFIPLRPGRPSAAAEGGEGAPGVAGGGEEPRVELMITDTRGWSDDATPDLGATLPASPPWRHAEARLLAQRIEELIVSGEARAGEVAILVRAASDLAVYERALEERGVPTLAAGGRGYWSGQQVQDLIAYLSVLANPLEEGALYGVLASPFGGLSSDALAVVALVARGRPGGAWVAVQELVAEPDQRETGDVDGPGLPSLGPLDRERLVECYRRLRRDRADAARLPLATLIARAVRQSGYERHVLALRGGRRRRANIRKLIRLAAGFEAANGPDLRGFLDYVGSEERREAREGDAPPDGGELDAVRLMTIHAAKGLEFPVVCVADLGRSPRLSTPWLIVDGDRVGVRATTLGMAEPIEALDHASLREDVLAAQDEEERRIVYVAMTRAQERLLLSGAADLERWPCGRRGAPPIGWVGRALVPGLPEPLSAEVPVADVSTQAGEFEARVRLSLNCLATLGQVLRLESEDPRPAAVLPGARSPVAAARPAPEPIPAPVLTVAGALSYSALTAYSRCGYRFYVQWVLGLPDADPPVGDAAPERGAELDARTRGTLVHALLEGLDFARPAPPTEARVQSMVRARGERVSPGEAQAMVGLVDAFAASPLCARLARARATRREHPFAFVLDESLLTGVVDVMADEGDGAVLIVDYKTDRLEGAAGITALGGDYRVQRSVYALAALRSGAREVEVAHCFLERPADLVSARYSASDIGGLEAELRALAEGLGLGRFPVAAEPHRELCLTCPARRSLCSWEESMTLRARPASLDASPAR